MKVETGQCDPEIITDNSNVTGMLNLGKSRNFGK